MHRHVCKYIRVTKNSWGRVTNRQVDITIGGQEQKKQNKAHGYCLYYLIVLMKWENKTKANQYPHTFFVIQTLTLLWSSWADCYNRTASFCVLLSSHTSCFSHNCNKMTNFVTTGSLRKWEWECRLGNIIWPFSLPFILFFLVRWQLFAVTWVFLICYPCLRFWNCLSPG